MLALVERNWWSGECPGAHELKSAMADAVCLASLLGREGVDPVATKWAT